MTKIYLIRHAEAEGNLYRRIQGHWDGRVTPRGRAQIDALAERFRDIPIDALYSSDLQRTQATAGAITRYHDLPLQTTPRLREICMGAWEGRPWGDVEFENPELMRVFNNDPARWSVPGGEPFAAVQERMCAVLRELAARHEGQTVAAVSHGMAIRAYICAVLGVPSAEIPRIPHGDNTAVALVTYENGVPTLEYYNDNSHLSEGLSTFGRQTWWKEESPDLGNLRFVPLRFPADDGFYTSCYADAWQAAHGSVAGFEPAIYLRHAHRHARTPNAVVKILSGGRVAGLVELDPARGAEEGCGWVSFLYLLPDYRGLGWGVQLLGHALWFFETCGRRAVRLHVAETNARAVEFYEHYGFQKIGRAAGVSSALYLMERPLADEAWRGGDARP